MEKSKVLLSDLLLGLNTENKIDIRDWSQSYDSEEAPSMYYGLLDKMPFWVFKISLYSNVMKMSVEENYKGSNDIVFVIEVCDVDDKRF